MALGVFNGCDFFKAEARHRNYHDVHSTPPKHLVSLLHYMEASSCNPHALSALVNRGCRTPGKKMLLELLEYIIDVSEHYDISEFTLMVDVGEDFKERNLARGRRARDIIFGENFVFSNLKGIYRAYPHKGDLNLYDTATMRFITLTGIFEGLDQEDVEQLVARITITSNFSRAHASLKIDGVKMASGSIHDMFVDHGKGAANFSRRIAMHGDNPCDDHGLVIHDKFLDEEVPSAFKRKLEPPKLEANSSSANVVTVALALSVKAEVCEPDMAVGSVAQPQELEFFKKFKIEQDEL
jgi:hypothetical protein